MSSSIDRIVERRIRDAQERGLFENLPGAGKPLEDLGGPMDENWWLRRYVLREGVDGVAFLPPALALRKEAQDLPAAVAKLRTESEVRAAVAKLNERILDALKKPSEGPAMTLMELDVDAFVAGWKAADGNRPSEQEETGESEERWQRPRSRLLRWFGRPPGR